MEGQATVASQVVLPQRLVELKYLKDVNGAPVRVLCEAVDELVVLEMFALPGARASASAEGAEPDLNAMASQLLELAPALIRSATSLTNADGSPLRPAFHSDDSTAVPGSIPWRLLRLEEKLDVVLAILQLSGVGGAAGAGFPGGDGKGSGDGVGAVAPGTGDGPAAA